MRVMKWSLIALAVSAGTTQFAGASSQSNSSGFIEDSTLTSMTRSMYMNSDYDEASLKTEDKKIVEGTAVPSSKQDEDWGIGQKFKFESGFSQGTIGVGIDAFAMSAMRINGGLSNTDNGMFGTRANSGDIKDTQSKTGAAIKFRISDTILKYGDQAVDTPVFETKDNRLIEQTATGTLINTDELVEGLGITAGHFTALGSQTNMERDSEGLTSADIFYAKYDINDNLKTAVAASDIEDYFGKRYVNLNYKMPLSQSSKLEFDLNGYRTISKGEKIAGNVDNHIWSMATSYGHGAHSVTLAYQRSTGDNGYYHGIDGAIDLANSMQYSDFSSKNERSWKGEYNVDMAEYGYPGLTFMAGYAGGNHIATDAGEGEEHEFNLETEYVMQEGVAKDLSLKLSSSLYRTTSNNGKDCNSLSIAVGYPLNLL